MNGGASINKEINSNDWPACSRTYQTRILSVANKVNLEFAEAAPPLRSGLVRVIAGPF
ncbi:complement resistance protein TraT [Paraburkholderia sp. BR13444]|uniref:complement resistance protein TraT n=1 Tax=Paraburkholderia TaxID=1822464 RepID=UPI0034CD45F7